MWKTALILLLAALAMIFAARALKAPTVETRISDALGVFTAAPAPLAPPLMYAGIRG